MNLALWIVAATLAAAYLAGGVFKLAVPRARIAAAGRSGRWVEDFSAGAVKAIGAVEVAAAAGLVLPAVCGIAPVLVPLAATGLVLLMAGAAVVRARRREYRLVAVDALYILLAAFVAWGRFGPAPFLN
ncbi:DoxX family protein [Streptomyces sp. 1331.2]|uniref:DoxX family protein n=1 Tax=Streptomyces sp. 1331.2 TaxID=1938835 RepID=UPI000BD049BB|nr:DoxX family protein [Streptomyces sp. 1331.2]SOB78821.1 DoxX-like family protein [Streptomyces sp. 1331.2]